MATLSSGHTQHLQDRALRNDKRNALLKVQKTWKESCCPNNIQPVAKNVVTCSGSVISQTGGQRSSNQLNNKMTNFGNYTYSSPSAVPESVRLQKLAGDTADASIGIPFRNADGSFSYLPNPATRFNQYAPYRPPPCAPALPYYATNAGNPVARIEPCVAPKILYI